MKHKRVLCVDADDVLFATQEEVIAFCRERYDVHRKKEHFTNPCFNEVWGVPKETLSQWIEEFDKAGRTKSVQPHPGAQDMLCRLSLHYDHIEVVTNRPKNMAENTFWSLDHHFPNQINDVHFCTEDWGRTRRKHKHMVCRERGSYLLLEDHPHTAHMCADDGIHVYLFDQPWNQQEFPYLSGAVIRISSWHDPMLETLFS